MALDVSLPKIVLSVGYEIIQTFCGYAWQVKTYSVFLCFLVPWELTYEVFRTSADCLDTTSTLRFLLRMFIEWLGYSLGMMIYLVMDRMHDLR